MTASAAAKVDSARDLVWSHWSGETTEFAVRTGGRNFGHYDHLKIVISPNLAHSLLVHPVPAT
jgi:hypothetical protein